MRDGHQYRRHAFGAIEQMLVARLAVEQRHLRHCDALALDFLGRRKHLGSAGDYLQPVLISAQAIENDMVVVVKFARRLQRHGDDVAQATGREKCSVWSM